MISITSVVRNGRVLRIADQDAVDAAEHGADQQGRNHRSQTGKPSTNRKNSAAKLAMREDRADAEVDAAGNQGQMPCQRDEAEFGKQPRSERHSCGGVVGDDSAK